MFVMLASSKDVTPGAVVEPSGPMRADVTGSLVIQPYASVANLIYRQTLRHKHLQNTCCRHVSLLHFAVNAVLAVPGKRLKREAATDSRRSALTDNKLLSTC